MIKKESLTDIKLISILNLMLSECKKAPYSLTYTVPIVFYQDSVDYINANLKIEKPFKVAINVLLYGKFCTVKYSIFKATVKEVSKKEVSKKEVSKKEVSKKEVSKKEVSKKKVSAKKVRK